MDGKQARNMNFGLLKFCLENMDDPAALANSTIDTNRDPKDYDFLIAALGDLTTETQKAIKLLNKLKETQEVFEIKACLEGLQYYCEDIDVSQGILKVQGLELVMTFINHDDEEVRYISAWVLASILQSNIVTQNYAIKINALEILANTMQNETDVNALGKQIYALSSALSENKQLTQEFVEKYNGIQILNKHLLIKTNDTTRPIKAKLIWVLLKIINNNADYKILLVEQETLKQLFEILKEDQESPQIRRNTIALLGSILKEAPIEVINYFKENSLPTINENLLEEDELTEFKSIQTNSLNSKK